MEQLLGIFRFFFSLRNYDIFMPPLHGKKTKKHLQGKAASCPLTPTGEPSVLFTVKVACHSCVETRDEALSIRLSQQNMFKLCKSSIHRELPGILALRWQIMKHRCYKFTSDSMQSFLSYVVPSVARHCFMTHRLKLANLGVFKVLNVSLKGIYWRSGWDWVNNNKCLFLIC